MSNKGWVKKGHIMPKKKKEELGYRLSYRIELYPTPDQIKFIVLNFRATRFVYNYFLRLRKRSYNRTKEYLSIPVRDENGKVVRNEKGEKVYEKVKNGKYDPEAKALTYAQTSKMLTALKKEESAAWLCNADAVALVYAIRYLDRAYKNFFDRARKKKQGRLPQSEKLGYPSFKDKDSKKSFTTHISSDKIENNRINLPKVGWVSAYVYRQIKGVPVAITVSRDAQGRFWGSINVKEVIKTPQPKTDAEVGIAMGISKWVVTSDGIVYNLPEKIKRLEKQLARQQKNLARKQKGSWNYRKQRYRVAQIQARIANLRKTATHQLTSELVNNYDFIATREMKTTDMAKGEGKATRNLPKKVKRRINHENANSNYFEINRQLAYKSAWAGRGFIQLSSETPTAQTCSQCGHVNTFVAEDLKQEWTCEECGATHDRKFNGALNVLQEARKLRGEEESNHE